MGVVHISVRNVIHITSDVSPRIASRYGVSATKFVVCGLAGCAIAAGPALSAGATAVCHRIPTRPCLLRTCRRLRQCPLCPRRRHLATFTALATFACRSGCTSAAVEAGAIVGADGAAVVTRAASSCGSFVRVTARWLPITDVRRGLTQILLSHNTVGSMTAINVKTHGATGDGTSDDYDRGEPGSRRQARGGDRPPIKGSAPLGPYCRDIPRK